MTRPTPVWIDTDPGVDDALALLLALRSPELQVIGVSTTHGNVSLRQATENACRVVEIANVPNPPPIYAGAAKPLKRQATHSPSVHGRDGLGEITLLQSRNTHARYPKPALRAESESAGDALARVLRRTRRKVTVVTLGPLTNLAQVLRKGDPVRQGIKRIVTMGGAVATPGNETPAAEFNVFCDPDAARTVIQSGIPMTLVGLDVTRRARITREQLRLATGLDTPVNRFLRDATNRIMKYYRSREGYDGCCLHDPLTVATLIEPGLITTKRLHVDVETAGNATLGMTVADMRPIQRGRVEKPNIHVALDVRPASFVRLLLRRVCDA